MRSLPLLAFALVVACASGPSSPFVRVTTQDGRVYYANMDRTLHSEAGGFLSFRDLITREPVQLKNGTYEALACPPEEVEARQNEYIDDPSRKPMASDYELEKR